MQRRGQLGGAPLRSTPAATASPGNASAKRGIFTADGTPITNQEAFVAGIQKRGYNTPILDSDGVPIKDPVAYVAAMLRRGQVSAGLAGQLVGAAGWSTSRGK